MRPPYTPRHVAGAIVRQSVMLHICLALPPRELSDSAIRQLVAAGWQGLAVA